MVIAKKAAMLLCALMCGCGGGSELRHVTLNEVTRSVFYAPLYCAVSLGYFEKEGLDVEIVTSGGSDKSMTALISGDAEVALMGPKRAYTSPIRALRIIP